jgi:bis(5'-nucleosyl)-tetraphosphatase (symmetrical)
LNPAPPRCFAIGDLQGCLVPLKALLARIEFRPGNDQLVLLGDLVNRGPQSLDVLRYVRSLGERVVVLLGNHDLHLLAAARKGEAGRKDSFQDVLEAPEAPALLDWLRQQRLAWQDPQSGVLCVHAGVPREWDLAQTLREAGAVESFLRSDRHGQLLDALYGNAPDRWDESLSGIPRLRFTINALTRQRMQHRDGRLDFRYKGPPSAAPEGLQPWFLVEGRRSLGQPIAFGHWSTLGQVHWPQAQVWGLDSGCVWGGALSALELGSGVLTQLPCPPQCAPGAD